MLWVGSSGSEGSFPCRVGHHDCSKAGNEMGKQKAADSSPGQADGGEWAIPAKRLEGKLHGLWKPKRPFFSSFPLSSRISMPPRPLEVRVEGSSGRWRTHGTTGTRAKGQQSS